MMAPSGAIPNQVLILPFSLLKEDRSTAASTFPFGIAMRMISGRFPVGLLAYKYRESLDQARSSPLTSSASFCQC